MDDTTGFGVSADEAAQIQGAIQECIQAMYRANERMKKDQEEIERLKAKTRTMLVELEATQPNLHFEHWLPDCRQVDE